MYAVDDEAIAASPRNFYWI